MSFAILHFMPCTQDIYCSSRVLQWCLHTSKSRMIQPQCWRWSMSTQLSWNRTSRHGLSCVLRASRGGIPRPASPTGAPMSPAPKGRKQGGKKTRRRFTLSQPKSTNPRCNSAPSDVLYEPASCELPENRYPPPPLHYVKQNEGIEVNRMCLQRLYRSCAKCVNYGRRNEHSCVDYILLRNCTFIGR